MARNRSIYRERNGLQDPTSVLDFPKVGNNTEPESEPSNKEIETGPIPEKLLNELRRLENLMNAVQARKEATMQAFAWTKDFDMEGKNLQFDIELGIYNLVPV